VGRKGIFVLTGACFSLFLAFSVYSIFTFSEQGPRFDKDFIYVNEERPETGILAEAKNAVKGINNDIRFHEIWEGRTKVIELKEGDTAEWEVEVPETGKYELSIGY